MALSPSTSYRVFVSTDLGGDPDDIQSLVHMLHYSDVLKIEGITSTTGPGSTPEASLIKEWVTRVDLDFLRNKGWMDLMSEQAVLDVVRQGAVIPSAPKKGNGTSGSRHLVECARRESDAVLWVLVWGSLTDVAQALHDDPGIAGRIRINSIGSSNTENDPESREYLYNGLTDAWPDLWWIEDGVLPKLSRDTFRGYYEGGMQDGEWGNTEYISRNIRGKGTNHDGIFSELLGDAFPTADWPAGSLKEGDSPTFTYLLSPLFGNVGNPNDPAAASWGGTFSRPKPDYYANYYTDLPATPDVCRRTINRFRNAYLGHWKDRWARYGN